MLSLLSSVSKCFHVGSVCCPSSPRGAGAGLSPDELHPSLPSPWGHRGRRAPYPHGAGTAAGRWQCWKCPVVQIPCPSWAGVYPSSILALRQCSDSVSELRGSAPHPLPLPLYPQTSMSAASTEVAANLAASTLLAATSVPALLAASCTGTRRTVWVRQARNQHSCWGS